MNSDQDSRRRGESILRMLAAHQRALASLRYGSFRGVVRDGKLVRLAIEHEWRPKQEGEPEME